MPGLTFVTGLPGTGKTAYCLDEMTSRLRDNPSGLFLIVPEQFSMQAERLLVRQVGAVINAQALSFGRLAYYVFARVGGAPFKHLTDVGKHMLLRRILHECDGFLPFYARATGKPGFVDGLSQMMTELSQYEITPDVLSARAETLFAQDEVLSMKLRDLSLIYRCFRDHTAERYLVTENTLDLLAGALNHDIPPLRGGMFWVDGFTGFTPQERRVLGRIMQMAEHVTISLTMDKPPADTRDVPESEFFHTTQRTMQTLIRLAGDVNVPVRRPVQLHTLHRHAGNVAQRHLTQAFPRRHAAEAETGRPRVVSLPDKYAEIEFAAEWITHVVRERGYAYRDIAVLCGDLPGYEKLARIIFKRHRVPVFIDHMQGVLSHPLMECARGLVDVAARRWPYESVFRLLKTGFTPLTRDEIDRMENFVMARGITGWKWEAPWRGDDEMESLRVRVAAFIAPFNEARSTVEGYTRRLFDGLYALDAPERLRALCESATAEEARRHKQIWPKLCEVCDKLVEILGDATVTLPEYAELLDAGLKGADLGLIPPELDQVALGDIGRSRYPEIKALIVLGANDGTLPKPARDGSLLTEDERKTLAESGVELAPDIPQQAAEGMLSLYDALCRPREELLILYRRADADGKAMRPSHVITRLKRIFPGLLEEAAGAAETEPPLAEGPAAFPALSSANVNLLYPQTFTTAASRLESYANCPYAYFLAYNLNARERKVYQVHALDLGILYHEVLARVTRDLTAADAWHTATRADLTAFVDVHAEAVVGLETDTAAWRSTARNAHILWRVREICEVSLWALQAQYRRGDFTVAGVETGFDGINIPLGDGRTMKLTGRIDRVDSLLSGGKHFLKVMDYKSGSTRFSADDALRGTQLQLPLYLRALMETNPGALAGGMFYFNMDNPFITSDAALTDAEREAAVLKSFKLSGLMTSDLTAVYGMDRHLAAGGESPVIPVGINKDGSYRKTAAVSEPAAFTAFFGDVEKRVKALGGRMVSGHVAPEPFRKGTRSGCDFCRFCAVCGFNKPGV
jgi:ATP-dependent helicase/nuclease subunit B